MKRFADMSEQQFLNVIDSYIDRVVEDEVEPPVNLFLDLLAQRLTQKVDQTMTLLVDIEDNEVTLSPDRESVDVIVRGNEIIVGNHRFVLQLPSGASMLTSTP